MNTEGLSHADLTASSLLDALDGVNYTTDLRGTITAVGRTHWNAFAAANAAPTLRADSVIGRDVFSFIGGVEVSRAFRAFVDIVTGRGETISFNFHCDAPETEREMRLCMTPIKTSMRVTGVLYRSLLLAETARPAVNLFHHTCLGTSEARNAHTTRVPMCSYCQRVKPRSGENREEWITAEQYCNSGGHVTVAVIHVICPTCDEGLVAPLLKGEPLPAQ